MFWKKSSKTPDSKTVDKDADKKGKTQTGKPAAKKVNAGAGKSSVKGKKVQTVKKPSTNSVKTQAVKKPAAENVKKQDASDRVLAKLEAIERETRLKQVKDNVDRLEDEKIAGHIEDLLKSIGRD